MNEQSLYTQAIGQAPSRYTQAIGNVGLGAAMVAAPRYTQAIGIEDSKSVFPEWYNTVMNIVTPVAVVSSLYHGAKRNDSIGWALAWGLFATVFPIPAVICSIAMSPGYAKRKVG